MQEWLKATRDRRGVMKTGLIAMGALAIPSSVSAADPIFPVAPAKGMRPTWPASAPLTSAKVVRPDLLRQALAALDRHAGRIEHRDRLAIADFAAPSREPRFHFVDLASGKSQSMLVAHGSGSDPTHSGWLSRFSNADGSNASCEGAFLASDYYVGKHGRSQRLVGLDATNNNALARRHRHAFRLVFEPRHGPHPWHARPQPGLFRGGRGRTRARFRAARPGPDDLRRQGVRLAPAARHVTVARRERGLGDRQRAFRRAVRGGHSPRHQRVGTGHGVRMVRLLHLRHAGGVGDHRPHLLSRRQRSGADAARLGRLRGRFRLSPARRRAVRLSG